MISKIKGLSSRTTRSYNRVIRVVSREHPYVVLSYNGTMRIQLFTKISTNRQWQYWIECCSNKNVLSLIERFLKRSDFQCTIVQQKETVFEGEKNEVSKTLLSGKTKYSYLSLDSKLHFKIREAFCKIMKSAISFYHILYFKISSAKKIGRPILPNLPTYYVPF